MNYRCGILCTLLRMLITSFAVGVAGFYNGDSPRWAMACGLASLVLMQLGYFAVVLVQASSSKRVVIDPPP